MFLTEFKFGTFPYNDQDKYSIEIQSQIKAVLLRVYYSVLIIDLEDHKVIRQKKIFTLFYNVSGNFYFFNMPSFYIKT